ncbi:uncharacterized protein LOC124162064 [Ischnura elegans]|uniref:uncharacterized protein LOC124162064 n=1 Tax=Ischnura elegans TaxID=197161 RepID=UPI001ED87DF5|nr:uncharacterized protein LOC124162064 [Ischnura elegans]
MSSFDEPLVTSSVTMTPQRILACENGRGLRLLVAAVLLTTPTQGAPRAGSQSPHVDLTAGAYLRNLPNITIYETALALAFRWDFNPGYQLQLLREMVGRACKTADNRPVCSLPRLAVDSALRDWDRRNWFESLSEAPLATDGGAMVNTFTLPTRRHSKRMIISAEEARELENDLAEMGGVKNLSAPCIPAYAPASGDRPDFGLLTLITSTIAAQRDVLAMCQTRRLSPSVVNVDRLRAELLSLQRSVHSRGWELAIQHFSRYYVLPLLDCLLSPSSLYLFLVIPLTKANTTSVSLHSFIPIPFAYGDFTCQITAPAAELALVRTAEGVKLGSLQCNPYRDELCSLESVREDESVPAKCAKLVALGGTAEEAAKVCPLHCQRSSETRVISLGPATFLITHPPADAVIRCDAVRWSDWGARRKGSFRITLPCDCQLSYNGSVVAPTFPCLPSANPTLSVRRLIPAEWSLLLSVSLPPFSKAHSLSCTDLDECTKSSWDPESHSSLELRPWMLYLNIAIILFLCLPSLFLSLLPYVTCNRPPVPFYLSTNDTSPSDRPPPTSPTRLGPPLIPPPPIPTAAASFRRPLPTPAITGPVYEEILETVYLPMRRRP